MGIKHIGLGLDYSNICKDYNTVYLDRDNDDPKTIACMKKALQWFDAFFFKLKEDFGYELYRLNQDTSLPLSQIVQKRFFFYSLEKEIISQTFIFQKESIAHTSLENWALKSEGSLLIQNDEEGEGIYFYVEEESKIHLWIVKTLSEYSLDEVPFEVS